MVKRKRNHELTRSPFIQVAGGGGEELKAVFVETNIGTCFACIVSPHSRFRELKEKIIKDHEECYRDFGRITINKLKVKRDQKLYHLSENIRLSTAFRGANTWLVFAHVSRLPLNHPPHSKSKCRNKKRSRTDFGLVLSTCSPPLPIEPKQLVSTPQVNGEIADVKPKKKMQKKHSTSRDGSSSLHMEQQLNANTQKTIVEQADLTPNHKVNDADYQEKVSVPEKTHNDSAEVRNVQSAGTELENNVQESELSGQIGIKPLPLHQISQNEEHLNVQTVEVVKPVEMKLTVPVNGLSEVEQRDFLQTNGTSNATKVKNTDLPMPAVAELKGENLTMSASSKQVMNSQVPLGDTVNCGTRKLGQNNPTRKSGVLLPNLNAGRKSSATSSLISVKSAKTINKGENVEVQKKNQETVFKTPSSKNMGTPVSSSAQENTLSAFFSDLYSDNSDDEVERNGSSCSLRILSDSSSSYTSEGESDGGESEVSRSARDDQNLNLSDWRIWI